MKPTRIKKKAKSRGGAEEGVQETAKDQTFVYAEDGWVGKLVRTVRHPLRLVAMILAALALTSGIAMTSGAVSAVLGVLLGVATGEVLGRSRLRLALVTGSVFALTVITLFVAHLCTHAEWLPGLLGPGTALKASAVLRYGSVAFFITCSLRALAVRKPVGLALELGAVVTSIAVLFAAHRDGVIARPLWLSDWAWQQGIDPGDIFLAIGATAAVVLAILLVFETRGGRTVSSLIALPAIALFAIACLDAVGTPTPEVDDGIGLTTEEEGDPPEQMPEDPNDPNGQDPGADSGQGQDPDGPDGGQGGAGLDGGDGGGASGGDGGDGGSSGGDGGDGGSAGGDGGDGGSAGEGDASNDGGGGGGSTDASDGGGSGTDGGDGGAGESDGGDAGGSADASTDPFGTPPPSNGEQGDGPPSTPPPSQQFDNESDQAPSNSPAPMAVVILETDYSPPSQSYYFRQEAWSQFNGNRLVRAEVEGADADTLQGFPARLEEVEAPPAGERTTVRARVALLAEHHHAFALESAVSFEPIRNPNPDRFSRAYRFESLAQEIDYNSLLGRNAGNPDWSEELGAMYLENHPDERFQELAEEIIEAGLPERMREDPFARALAIKIYLDRELIYSTGERHANVEDSTVDFLFGNRTGYCVHFAHSTVFLWRAAGIPARVSTGYMVSEESRRGGSAIMIRAGDAHAWPELYIEGVGWVVLDIAAERNLDEPGNPVDEDLQRMLGEMAREQPADPEDEIQDEPEEDSKLWTFFTTNFWLLASIFLGLILFGFYQVKLWRRFRPMFAGQASMPRVGYRAQLDRLSEVGLAREFGETREQFAERISERIPSFEKLTDMHVAARLGDPNRDPGSRSELDSGSWKSLSRAVGKEVGSTTKFWRRLLGWLHPVSFFDSK